MKNSLSNGIKRAHRDRPDAAGSGESLGSGQPVRWSRPVDGLLRVGISGHRDLSSEDLPQIRAEVRSALTTLARDSAATALSADPGTVCRLVSGLAAGADQLVAEEALAIGWTLEALLPMAVEDYLADFVDPTARAGFERLMAGCVRVTVINRPLRLDGDVASPRDQSYRNQGSRLVEAVHAMILVWDGRPAGQGACGTSWVARLCQDSDRFGQRSGHPDAHGVFRSDRVVVISVRRVNG